mmetsp:Transcript_19741/g.42893  ORF Transcript_19741/g.42893 Transcript_19741/m.42893 type:complete len:219 (+) Transcript_19741:194-850(+)
MHACCTASTVSALLQEAESGGAPRSVQPAPLCPSGADLADRSSGALITTSRGWAAAQLCHARLHPTTLRAPPYMQQLKYLKHAHSPPLHMCELTANHPYTFFIHFWNRTRHGETHQRGSFVQASSQQRQQHVHPLSHLPGTSHADESCIRGLKVPGTCLPALTLVHDMLHACKQEIVLTGLSCCPPAHPPASSCSASGLPPASPHAPPQPTISPGAAV